MDAIKARLKAFARSKDSPLVGDRLKHAPTDRGAAEAGRELLRSSLALSMSASLDLTASVLGKVASLVIQLDSPAPDDVDSVFSNAKVGGKALHLAEMIAHAKLAGSGETLIRVPAASVVTTAAYDAHIEALGIATLLQDTLVNGNVQALPQVREKIQGPSSADPLLRAGIKQFLLSCPATVQRFAVRSSSTAEDQGAASFAGQYETCLNVPRDEIVAAIKRCWASMWTERILSYRKSAGFSNNGAKLSMAVVVQQQVKSEAAGVAFSLNPVTGLQEQTVVECVWGQGEGLVGGSITPHSFQVDWHQRAVIKATDVKQTKKFGLLSEANKEGHFVDVVKTTEHEQSTAPLTTAQVLHISDMALRIAAIYGVPYDIEWAREGDAIYLLQARPITSFALQVAGLWDYAGFDESCVLTLSMSAHAYAAMMSQAMTVPEADLHRVFFCKAYINSELWHSFSKKLRGARKGKRAEAIVPPVKERIEACVAKFEASAALRDQHTADSLLALLSLQDELNTASFVVGEAAEYAEGVVNQYVRWLNQDFGTTLSLAPLVDGINYASEASYSSTVLQGLGFLCAACPPLFELFASGGTLQQARAIKDASAEAFVAQFDAFVQRFFFMSNRDEDLSGLRWVDDPSVPWGILGSLVRAATAADTKSFKARLKNVQTMIASPRSTVMTRDTDTLLQGQKDLLAAVQTHMSQDTEAHVGTVQSAVQALRALLHLKEQIHVVYTHNNYHLRRTIVQLCLRAGLAQADGEHWNGKTLLRTHPIFSLSYDSLRVVWGLPLAEQKRLLSNSALEAKMFRLLHVPPRVGSKVVKHVIERSGDGGADQGAGARTGAMWKGVGCSAGQVTGVARFIESVDQAGLFTRDEILLTRYTDPSWTPLMALAKAIVLVDGGILAHAAVVARELKIPCVVQLRETTLIKSGSTITVDGSTGYVTLVSVAN